MYHFVSLNSLYNHTKPGDFLNFNIIRNDEAKPYLSKSIA